MYFTIGTLYAKTLANDINAEIVLIYEIVQDKIFDTIYLRPYVCTYVDFACDTCQFACYCVIYHTKSHTINLNEPTKSNNLYQLLTPGNLFMRYASNDIAYK